MMLIFDVPGKPRGKGRHRSRVIHSANRKSYAIQYADPATVQAERSIHALFLHALNGRPVDILAPVKISILALFVPPKSISKKRKQEIIGKPCMSKPDADNIAKLVADALNGTAYRDDKQVIYLACEKRWDNVEQTIVTINWEQSRHA